MATCSYPLSHLRIRGLSPLVNTNGNSIFFGSYRCNPERYPSRIFQATQCISSLSGAQTSACIELSLLDPTVSGKPFVGVLRTILSEPLEPSVDASYFMQRLAIADLDPATAKVAIGLLGPFLSAFAFLFILRIVMSWYPKLPVGKFPYVIAYAPTEPILIPTRKLIPPLGGVDVTPVVWFGLISFLNEILLGPQGLLVLISQQVS